MCVCVCVHSYYEATILGKRGEDTTIRDYEDDTLLEVRYAVTRISIFQNYITYEILKSSSKKPGKVPECVEGIFVTRK